MPPLVREVIGDVLREARTTQGRTLREVSDSARVSLGYLSEVERGRKEPSSEVLAAAARAAASGTPHGSAPVSCPSKMRSTRS